MTSIREDHLEFDFDASWDYVEKWDDSPACRDGIQKVGGIDALDIVAFSESRRECLLLEIKDYRDQNEAGAAPQRRRRGRERQESASAPTANQVSAQLTEMVGQKAAGTVAGLVGAARMRDETFAHALAGALSTHRSDGITVHVVLWVEGKPTSQGSSPRSKVNLSALTNALKRKVAWLTNHPVHVLSTASPPDVVPGLKVTDRRP
ncbi:MAG: hypothetical protein EVA89_00395 [Sandaracinaceae bacterium]|nr:MAG: hypothetical protein EVA89_00395 [Sandaracinaceae bacterium]